MCPAPDEKVSLGSVMVQVFEVAKEYHGADFHKAEGTFCAQYMEGSSATYAWGVTEEAALNHLRLKVTSKLLEQHIVRVFHRELQLSE